MGEVVAGAGLIAMTAPCAISGEMAGTVIINTQGGRIKDKVWKHLYLSKSVRVTYSQSNKESFLYLQVCLSQMNTDLDHCHQIDLTPDILFILSNPACPYHDDFFDKAGNVIKTHIYIPNEIFYIKSDPSADGSQNWAWIQVRPILNGPNISGFDFWTYTWFWGIFYGGLTPRKARDTMHDTINSCKAFRGMHGYVSHIKNSGHHPTNLYGQFVAKYYTKSS